MKRVSERQYKRVTRGGVGSNQYKRQAKARRAESPFNPLSYLFYLAVAFAIVLGAGVLFKHLPCLDYPKQAQAAELISPLVEDQASPSAVLTPTTPTPTVDQHSVMAGLIRQVFGKDSDKAFTLLSCENSALNPNAVNTAGNYPPGSRDIGIFQINEYWQKTQARFLFDPEINVRAAYLIYHDSGDTFKMWSCGRKLGI